MVIAISGSSGFIGTYLIHKFTKSKNDVFVLDRHETDSEWANKLIKSDVIINLAGSPILTRWTKKNQNIILNSRVTTTRRIVSILNGVPPANTHKLLISISATGIYPENRPVYYDEFSNETGDGFLAGVVSQWEHEASNLINPSVRLIISRLGVVIGKEGGFLKPILPLFKTGLGGTLGSGKQQLSFIHIEDVYRAFLFFINTPSASGLYNLVTPDPITNKEFTKILSAQLHRPAILHVPAFAVKLFFGKASSVILNGSKVYPQKLLDSNFDFLYPTMQQALEEVFDD